MSNTSQYSLRSLEAISSLEGNFVEQGSNSMYRLEELMLKVQSYLFHVLYENNMNLDKP